MSNNEKIANEYLRLIDIIRVLRSPDGCPWDKKQDFGTMGKHIMGEANEVCEALDEKDSLHIKEELGDLLMNVVMTAQIADEAGTFDMSDIAHDICEKLILRHPHIFGENKEAITAEQVVDLWGKIKTKEKSDKGKLAYKMREAENFKSAIASVIKIQSIASEVGFDWNNAIEAFPKIKEETVEVEEAIKSKNQDTIEEEIGDLLFATLNVARLAGIDAEKALRNAGKKFVNRFETVEEMAIADGGFEGKTLEQLDVYWNKAKRKEK